MLDAYMYTGKRSPFGRHAGALAKMRPDDMLASVIATVVAESGFAADKIEDVVVGCGNQGGEDSRCVARHAALVAGLPIEIPGSVLQRNCGSGLNAIAVAAQAITCGEGEVFVAGGVESMSRAPFVMGKAEAPFSRDARVFDSTIGRGPRWLVGPAPMSREEKARTPISFPISAWIPIRSETALLRTTPPSTSTLERGTDR